MVHKKTLLPHKESLCMPLHQSQPTENLVQFRIVCTLLFLHFYVWFIPPLRFPYTVPSANINEMKLLNQAISRICTSPNSSKDILIA